MKTYNLNYKGLSQLKQFIEDKNLKSHQNILLQIFTGNCDIGFIKELVDNTKALIPNIKIVGTTTNGEIIDGKALENSTILSFSIFEKTKIETYYAELNSNSYKIGQNIIKQIKGYPKIIISFIDGLKIDGDKYLESFDEYREDLIVSGGLAGNNRGLKNTIVFTQDSIENNGAVIATLDNRDLNVYTKTSFGWESIGKTMTITKANKNLVYEIDGIRAVDIYKKYLGKEVTKLLPKTGIEFPLIIKREHLDIPRTVIAIGENGSLYFGGNIKEGEKVSLGYGNIEAILKYSNKVTTDRILHNSESIFIYSCMSRLDLMQDYISQEIEALSQISTVSGFFSYGEFYSCANMKKNQILNQTMTILGLSEKNSDQKREIKPLIDIKSKNNLTLKALSTLISETSKELEKANIALQKCVEHDTTKESINRDTLKRRSNLAQIGQTLSMIAHHWRQPLAAISSALLSIQVKLHKNRFNFNKREDREEFLNMLEDKHDSIFSYLESLSETIDNFKNFFKPNSSKEKVAITQPIDHALSILEESTTKNNIKINLSYKNRDDVYIYKNEMMQVVLNILKNALDNFVDKKISNPIVDIKTKKENEKIIIEICDNGGGIDNKTLPNIFDIYFSTKNNKNGTGLGLYISKVIVEEHNNGTLSVKNTDKGVCFKIELPYNKK